MKQPLLELTRILVGLLFTFSGFVKVVDPTGGAIKIEDYFVAWGMDFVPFGVSLALSFVQNVAEFAVGFALLMRSYVRLASLGALIFMAIFTPLTLYIAIANPVSDCGCFGDAVKLTNWETFFKNIVFLPMTVFLFMNGNRFKEGRAEWRKLVTAGTGVLIAFLVQLKGIIDEPIIDFRPFHIGQDINWAMSYPEDAPQPEYKTTFILAKDGVQQEFDEHDYPYEDSTWVYVDTRTETVSEGYEPPIHDFTLLTPDGDLLTPDILESAEPVVLVVSPQLAAACDSAPALTRDLQNVCRETGLRMHVLTASLQDAQKRFAAEAQDSFDFLMGDETMLKTIVRTNPGVIIIQNGTIINKFALKNAPLKADWKRPLATALQNASSQREQLTVICIILAAALIVGTVKKKKRRNYEQADKNAQGRFEPTQQQSA